MMPPSWTPTGEDGVAAKSACAAGFDRASSAMLAVGPGTFFCLVERRMLDGRDLRLLHCSKQSIRAQAHLVKSTGTATTFPLEEVGAYCSGGGQQLNGCRLCKAQHCVLQLLWPDVFTSFH